MSNSEKTMSWATNTEEESNSYFFAPIDGFPATGLCGGSEEKAGLVEGLCGLAGKSFYYLASPAQKITLSLKYKSLKTGNVI